jgi:protein-disulfide isomerase
VLIIPIISWYLLKPILKRNQAAKYEKRSYLKLKYDEQVFNSLLQRQPSIIAYPTEGLGITIGNPNATKTIVKVCNPYCGPCATAHPELEKIIKDNPSIKAQIIFTTTNNEKDRGLKPVKHLLAIAAKGDDLLTEHALDDWYLAKEKNYDKFAIKYPINGELQKQAENIDLMKTWCDKVKIEYTPTIYIDGYKLPRNYQLKDINYFLS